MEAKLLLLLSASLSLLTIANGGVLLSTLPCTLVVTASPKPNQVLTAGEDTITVTWRLNASGATYRTAKVRLCYAPVSQVDRAWRKTNDDLSKDKTCQFAVAAVPFRPGTAEGQSVAYTMGRDIPTATYFVRVYALDGDGREAAYGQTTDAKKGENLFEVKGITGRHASIDAAAACFSVASVAALVGFFAVERWKGRK